MLTPDESHENNWSVVFEDDHYIAVDKPSGLLVHPYWKETNETECLLKYVRDYVGQWVYPCHRLDRPTSGITLFAKDKEPARKIQDIWHQASTQKFYLALIRNTLDEAGSHLFDLGNEKKIKQKARTHFWPLKNFERCALIKVQITTGRLHQIRRHFSRRCQHVLGDSKYGKGQINHFYKDEFGLQRLFLHHYGFNFTHPYTNQEMCLRNPIRSELSQVLENLEEFSSKDLIKIADLILPVEESNLMV